MQNVLEADPIAKGKPTTTTILPRWRLVRLISDYKQKNIEMTAIFTLGVIVPCH